MKLRQQGDNKGDEASRATRKDCSLPIMVRPEFGPETQIKNILRKYGALPLPTRQPQYTETNFDEDLTTALSKIERARRAFDELPKKHKDRFPNPEALWKHYHSGQPFDDREPETKTDTVDKPETNA